MKQVLCKDDYYAFVILDNVYLYIDHLYNYDTDDIPHLDNIKPIAEFKSIHGDYFNAYFIHGSYIITDNKSNNRYGIESLNNCIRVHTNSNINLLDNI